MREEFGILKHISCIAHLINGIGQECIGLHNYKVPSEAENTREIPDNEEDFELDDKIESQELEGDGDLLKGLVMKVKHLVRFFRKSVNATSELERLQKDSGIPSHQCLKLIQEVQTRWNSCYEMLERFL